jgi:hypothetical protein
MDGKLLEAMMRAEATACRAAAVDTATVATVTRGTAVDDACARIFAKMHARDVESAARFAGEAKRLRSMIFDGVGWPSSDETEEI